MTDNCETSYGEIASFDGRGAQGSVHNAVAEQERREMRSRIENPGAYVYSDIMANDSGNFYRTGKFKDSAYMTVEDIRRLFLDEMERRSGDSGCAIAMIEKEIADRNIKTDKRPAHAYTVNRVSEGNSSAKSCGFKADNMPVYSDAGRKIMAVEKNKKNILTDSLLINNSHKKNVKQADSMNTVRRSFATVAAVSLCFVFTLVLMLPITLSIMINNESTEIAGMTAIIRSKESEIEALEVELNQKNQRLELEKIAVNQYGMVELDSTNYNVLKISVSDAIENFDGESENSGAVLALLSALGLRYSGE